MISKQYFVSSDTWQFSFCCSLLEQVPPPSGLLSFHHRPWRREEETCRGYSRYPRRWLYPAYKKEGRKKGNDKSHCRRTLLSYPPKKPHITLHTIIHILIWFGLNLQINKAARKQAGLTPNKCYESLATTSSETQTAVSRNYIKR